LANSLKEEKWMKHPCNTRLHWVIGQDQFYWWVACGFKISKGSVAKHRINKKCLRCLTVLNGKRAKKIDRKTALLF